VGVFDKSSVDGGDDNFGGCGYTHTSADGKCLTKWTFGHFNESGQVSGEEGLKASVKIGVTVFSFYRNSYTIIKIVSPMWLKCRPQ